ncbi:MAG: MBL fold metallo-hydrolase [Sedimentisphaeraceae bacterium JB056]
MRVCIHRGCKQIGGSCVEVEKDGQRLLVDIGLPLDAEGESSKYLPEIEGLDGKDESLLGILISHPHIDHFGLLEDVSPVVPIGIGAAARRILKAAAPFLPNKKDLSFNGWELNSEKCIRIGPFTVTPYLVDHSAYDSYAFKIESGGKSLFYSGDFRAHGRKAALFERLISDPPKNIDVLLMEGSSLGRISEFQQFPTEDEIEDRLTGILSQTAGLGLVHTSGQNIDRIVSVFRASKKTGRKLVLDLYTASILHATKNRNIPQSYWSDVALYVPQAQRIKIKKNRWFELLERHSSGRIYIDEIKEDSNKFTLLFRPLHGSDLEKAECLEGAAYIYSQWEGYWEQGSYDFVKKWLCRNSIPKYSVHTSGHASLENLKEMASAINPASLVPIHSFMPERYLELFDNVHVKQDNEWWNV